MARPKKDPPLELKRVQFDMSPKSLERLRRLQQTTEAASYAEVMRRALKVYEFLLEQVQETGPLVTFADETGTVTKQISLAAFLP